MGADLVNRPVEQEVIALDRTPPRDEMLALLPNARAVLTAERDPAAEFDLLVRSVIDGLHARLLTAPG